MAKKRFPFEVEASKGNEPPVGLTLSQLLAFYCLKELYKNFNGGTVTKEEAAETKERIYRTYVTQRSEEEFLERKALDLQERIRSASEAYKHDRTIENADKLYAAFYNVADNWYEETEKETKL